MGGRTCKTSHLGKNTLKNRRFLESNNADSGEHVQGLPKSGVWSFGLDAEEVLSPGAGWILPLSTGPLRPQALPSAPCPFGVGCHFLLGNLPNPGIEPRSPAL